MRLRSVDRRPEHLLPDGAQCLRVSTRVTCHYVARQNLIGQEINILLLRFAETVRLANELEAREPYVTLNTGVQAWSVKRDLRSDGCRLPEDISLEAII